MILMRVCWEENDGKELPERRVSVGIERENRRLRISEYHR